MIKNRRKENLIRLTFSYILLTIIAICCLYPALWVIVSSMRPGTALFSPTFLPKKLTLEHYSELFNSTSIMFGRWYLNTLKIAFLTMLFSSALVLMTAYSLSRFRFKGRKITMTAILVIGMFPGFMSLIAIYILLMQLNLLDTHTAIVLVYSAGAGLGAFVVKGFFDSIPKGIEESARIDGASHMQVFTKIMLPLSKPMLVYVMLTTFTGAWGDFIFARAVLRTKEQWTIAVGMWDMVNSQQNSNFTLFAAGSVLVAVPITLLFMYLQRFLVEGLTAGANKG
ncbi:sugar ABC transporter permease [Paenibacillus albiflavus]|uniref:Sugar ABC transporter permease n=1 Tax=Paenibacillus albiflavus TaxID=2545760 RepID=A0A4R4E7B7_9BACL|nr:sugar ABC transporter permease [Paenibacillus albiflavus]TCZ74700.1 sugar ABC transporter permease [Paenibacillus albiflavus]